MVTESTPVVCIGNPHIELQTDQYKPLQEKLSQTFFFRTLQTSSESLGHITSNKLHSLETEVIIIRKKCFSNGPTLTILMALKGDNFVLPIYHARVVTIQYQSYFCSPDTNFTHTAHTYSSGIKKKKGRLGV